MSATDLTPDLAEKVLQAEQRNLVKKVGAGQTLSTPQRQMIMGLAAVNASPEELRTTRANALLKKWLDGGRLGRDEREEVAQMFPDAVFIINGGDDDKPTPLTEKEVMERYELSRATFFRWKNHGASLPDGPDAPPWEDAVALVAWYERMRARGLFKHKCPRSLLNATRQPATPPAPSTTLPAAPGKPAAPASGEQRSSPPSSPRQSPEKRGFLAELESLQEETAMMREAFQQAEKDGQVDQCKLLKAEYFETLETLRKYEKDKEQIAVASGELVRKTDVEKDLAERLPSIVTSLEILIDRVDAQLITTLDRATRRTIWRNGLAECFKTLRTSRFAPPFALLPA
jgi:hypothetical protein